MALAVDVAVEWDAVDDDRVELYEVHWGTASQDYQWNQQATATSSTLDGLQAGQTYHVAVRACSDESGFCSDFSNEISVVPAHEPEPPQAGFEVSASAGVAPHAAVFTNLSSGAVDSYRWSFGDSTESTEESPTHTYLEPGSYSVTLTVSGPGGTSTMTQDGAVSVDHAAPVADFSESATSGVGALTVTFADQSVGEIDACLWDFGDGSGSTAATAVHTYTEVGTYTVSLTVQGAGGEATKTKTDLIVVQAPAPSADFSSDIAAGEAPLTIAFASTADGSITSYHWDFGDGGTSTSSEPVHTYEEPGEYDVSLTVSGPGGSDTLTLAGYVQVDSSELALEAGEIWVDHEWQRVSFERSFTDPVVVVKPLSGNGGDPATVRVDAIDGDGFWVRIQEWGYLDDSHTVEAVGYLVLERGIHRLPDGSRIEADLLALEGEGDYAFASFATNFEQAPVVISAVVSVNDDGPITTRMRGIDHDGFELKLQSEEAGTLAHGAETVAFVAWEPSAGTLDGRPFEVGRTADAVAHEPHRVDFGTGFDEPPVLIADMQSTDGGDTANLRWRNKARDAVEVWVDEEQSRDDEINHTTETVGYIVLGQSSAIVPAGLELGEITVGSDWQTVAFEKDFTDPVVVAKIVSSNDPDPVIVRIDAVHAAGFDIRLQEWDYQDDWHAPETVVYLVAERGQHQLPNGARLEAGRIDTDATNRFTAVNYRTPFSTAPVVVAAVTSVAGDEAVTTRQRAIDQYGFDIGLEEEEAADQVHATETISFIAIETGTATWDGLHFEVGRTADEVKHGNHALAYAVPATLPPLLLADMQSCDGGDTATVRVSHVDAHWAELRVEEEQSRDPETKHTTETVGYILLHDADDLSL